MLPADYARCPGERVGDGWLSDCFKIEDGWSDDR